MFRMLKFVMLRLSRLRFVSLWLSRLVLARLGL
jgi:hypothetical protein